MSKRKLLLADDSITIQKVVNLTFADEGIEVITVGDGDAAMQKFVEVMPDLVMADVNMPGADGYRICEMIKQDDETRKIPVILLVGSFEPFDEEEARRVGADDYLTKPFQSIRQLVNMVTDLLDATNGEEPASVEETTQNETAEEAESHEPIYMETAAAQLGDAGMDDEMIQTNQIGVVPVDEPQKFESESVEQSFAEVPPTTLRSPYQSDFESSTDYESEADFAKTQPLTTQEYRDITVPSPEDETVSPEEKGYELLDEPLSEQAQTSDEIEIIKPEISDNEAIYEPQEVVEQQVFEPETADEPEQSQVYENEPAVTDESEFAPTLETSELVPMPEVASVLDLDEMNLLELPPREKKDSTDFQFAPVAPEESATVAEEPTTEFAETRQSEPIESEETEPASTAPAFMNLSPETIEAIAERVADLVVKKWSQQPSDSES